MKKYLNKMESTDIIKILDSVNSIEKYQKDKHDQRKYKSRIQIIKIDGKISYSEKR